MSASSPPPALCSPRCDTHLTAFIVYDDAPAIMLLPAATHVYLLRCLLYVSPSHLKKNVLIVRSIHTL